MFKKRYLLLIGIFLFLFIQLVSAGVIIHSPSANLEIVNTLSTTLNISNSGGFNSTILYSWNNGIKNYTLCNNCIINNWTTITFPRQGYYNLSVYAFNSSSSIQTNNSNNLFVGNRSKFNDIADVRGYDNALQSDGSIIKYNITSLPKSNILIKNASYYLYINFGGATFSGLLYSRIDNQSWTEAITPSQFNALVLTNSSSSAYPTDWYTWTSINDSNLVLTDILNNFTSIKLYSLSYTANEVYSASGLRAGDIYGGTLDFEDRENSLGTGNFSYLNISYYSSNFPPSITNTLLNNSNLSTYLVNFTFNISDDNDYLTNISLILDGIINKTISNVAITQNINNSLNFSITNIPDGTHIWSVRAYDSDLVITNSTNFTINIDSTIPSIQIISPTNNTNSSNINLNINFTTSDLHLSNCWYSNDTYLINTSITCGQNISISWSQGRHNITLWSNDTFGNVNSSSLTFFIDSLSPTLTWIFPSDDGYVFDGYTNTFNYTISDSGIGISSCWWSNNSGVSNYSITCGNNITDIEVADGSYNITLWSNDSLNNVNSIIRKFVINSLDPTVTLSLPSNNQFLNYNQVIFNFSVTDTHPISSCRLYGNWSGNFLINQTNSSSVSNSGTIYNFNQVNLLDGSYIWNVNCNETNGRNAWYGINRTINIDTVYPKLTLTSPLNTTYTTNQLTLNYSTTDINLDSCWYNLNNGTNISTNCNNVSFIASQGSSKLYLFSNDSANNVNTSSITFFVDSINPNINLYTSFSNGSYLNYNNSIIINLTISDTNLNTCWYNDNSGNNNLISCGNNLSLNLSEGFHTINISSNDTLNNKNSTKISFTTDVTYPALSSIITTTTGSQTISFDTSINDTNINSCKYSIFDSTGSIDGLNNNVSFGCGAIGVTATVSAYGTYNLTIYAIDKAGNENYSTKSFTTSPISSLSVGGGGGATVQPIPVIGLLPINGTREYTDLEREVVYSFINNYCSTKVRAGLSISDYSESCNLIQSEIQTINSNLSDIGVNLVLEDLIKFYGNFKDNMLFQGYATQSDIDKYSLFTSVLGLTNLLSINPPSLDNLFVILTNSNNYTLFYSFLSNKPLKSCEILNNQDIDCIVENSTIKVYYNIKDTNFLSKIFSGSILVTTDTNDINKLESKKVNLIFRVYNANYKGIFGIPIYIVIATFGVFIIAGALFYYKKSIKRF